MRPWTVSGRPADQALHLVRLLGIVAEEVVADDRARRDLLEHGMAFLEGLIALERAGLALMEGVLPRCVPVPQDLILVRKIGHPDSPEYAVGAIAENGDLVFNPAEAIFLDSSWLSAAAAKELQEARRQRVVFLQDRVRIPATQKVAIIVDDGLATGLTMEAAIEHVR